jgi:hypothetical protein
MENGETGYPINRWLIFKLMSQTMDMHIELNRNSKWLFPNRLKKYFFSAHLLVDCVKL